MSGCASRKSLPRRRRSRPRCRARVIRSWRSNAGFGRRSGALRVMRKRLGLMIGLAALAGSAALVALMLGYVAHNDIGLTRLAIRHSALIAGAVLAMLLVA